MQDCSAGEVPDSNEKYYNLERTHVLDGGQQTNLTDQELLHVRSNVLSEMFFTQLDGSCYPRRACPKDKKHDSSEYQSDDASVVAVSDNIESMGYHNTKKMSASDGEQHHNSTDQELGLRQNALSEIFYTQLDGSSNPRTASPNNNPDESREALSNDGFINALCERLSAGVPTSSTSPSNRDLHEIPSEKHYSHREMGKNMCIEFHPDFICYRETYYTDCVVIFRNSSIEVKGSAVSVSLETFSTQFAIRDINQIQLEHCARADAGQFNIRVIPRCSDSEQSETDHETSEIEEMQFYVHDSIMSEKCEAITSLNEYKAVWNSKSVVNEHWSGVQNNKFEASSKVYFPSCDESFEEVIYPKGESDAVSISKRDFDLLQPDTFINDTIIDFYIMYLKNKIQPEKRHRYHFFNSFFFRKLADLDKDPSNAFDGKAAFLRVRKWTRKVNLFEKDFVFIPVNYNLHWSLIVICHPGEVANLEADNARKLSRVPCVLHMDSLRGSHAGLKDLFQSYLLEEWKERLKEFGQNVSSKFLNLRFASLEVPQQQNLCDCGLFLLHYVERFLEEDPSDVNLFSISKNSHFLSRDWFHHDEPYCKRSHIQRLIHDLLLPESPCESSSSDESEAACLPFHPNDIQFPSHHHNPCESISPLGLRVSSFEDDADLQARLHTHFGTISAPFNEVRMSPIEEVEEGGGASMYAPTSNEAGFEFPFSARDDDGDDVTPATSWRKNVSLVHDEQIDSKATVDEKETTSGGETSLTENLSVLTRVRFVRDDEERPSAKRIRLSPAEREADLKAHSEDLHF